MRLFLGIPLAAKVKEELTSITHRLRSIDDGLRWSSPESWHITLQFLGSVQPDQYACLGPQLHKLDAQPVSIQPEGLRSFLRAGVFILTVNLTPSLLLLQQHVVAATAPCGFVPESRAYQPHITLARSRGKPSPSTLRNLESRTARQPRFSTFVAAEFLLYESFLGTSGSRYEIRDRFPLRSA